MHRLLACLFAALIGLVTTLVVDVAPAGACSCAAGTDAEAFARGDAVFVGRVAGYAGPDQASGSFSSTDPAVWTFAVSQVYKGTVTSRQAVVSEVSGASCGLELPHRGEFLVFAATRGSGSFSDLEPGQLYAGLCGGTRALADGALDPTLASAHAPAPGPGTGSKPEARAVADTVETSDGWPVLPIVGAAIVLGLGIVLIMRQRRRTAAPHE